MGGTKIDLNKIRGFKAEVDATIEELRDDWNESIDKFGILPSDYPEIKEKPVKKRKATAKAKPRKKKS